MQNKHLTKTFTRLTLGLLAFGLLISLNFGTSKAYAQSAGDLIVAPTRVVFEGRARSAQLSIANKGSSTATFRISVVNMKMAKDGSMSEISRPEEGQLFAEKLFRFSPRQVTLQPGASQAIRLLLRKPKNLKDGEYRSHLFMRALPSDAGQSIEQAAGQTDVQIKLIPIFGITIPVIIRQGKIEMTSSLSDLKITPAYPSDKLQRLKFNINRQGERSVFGDLTIRLKPAGGGEEVIVGQIQRLAVYTPNTVRQIEMPLRIPNGAALSGGKLSLVYETTDTKAPTKIAEASISAP